MRKQNATHQQQHKLSWRRVVMHKWLNMATSNSDYSADAEADSDSDQESCDLPRESHSKNEKTDGVQLDDIESLPKLKRRQSETFRAQYINTKEIRICAGTWNVGGKIPPDDLDLDGWLDFDHPADIYVIGLQEIIPLNAGNIFGTEHGRSVSTWENLIRETLNRVPPVTKFKCYSDPASPTKFKPFEDAPNIEDEIVLDSDSDFEEEINSSNDDDDETNEVTNQPTIILSCTERIGLSWPEKPLNLLAQHGFERPNSFKSNKTYNTSKSFGKYDPFKLTSVAENITRFDIISSLAELDLELLIKRKRRPPYIRILSKQMVGVFITVWVRRSLRKHIYNLNVSMVGVGLMGYIGNKGSISVSMSIHQTLFCFVCTHLTSGEKQGDVLKRNAGVHEIHRRTSFNSISGLGLHTRIYDHERIIWLGDLNYRINLSYEQSRELISLKDWPQLIERDQLIKEFRKGRAFDGWSEGTISFAPTYKYEVNSDSYCGEDPKVGRRIPAWCDRIISFGTGMKLLSYRRSEIKFSDHRPVTATYLVEVEVFSPRKLKRALAFTDAEIKQLDILGQSSRKSRLRSGEDSTYWEL